jgi:uncharacterized membrane protein YedE/YeeE
MALNISLFEARVQRRRRTAAWFSLSYFVLLALAEGVLDFLVFWVAMPLMDERARWVAVGILGVLTVLAYMAGWSSQRNFKGTIDTWLADADPVEKLVLSAAIQDDHKKLEQLEYTIEVKPIPQPTPPT